MYVFIFTATTQYKKCVLKSTQLH